jgi:hypothetical protein
MASVMETSSRPYAFGAAILSTLQAALVAAQLATRHPSPGFDEVGTLVLGGSVSLIWLVAAGGMPFHRKWGGAFGIAGALTSLNYGLLIASVGDHLGVLYFAIGVVLLFLMKRALPWFGWSVFGTPAVAR